MGVTFYKLKKDLKYFHQMSLKKYIIMSCQNNGTRSDVNSNMSIRVKTLLNGPTHPHKARFGRVLLVNDGIHSRQIRNLFQLHTSCLRLIESKGEMTGMGRSPALHPSSAAPPVDAFGEGARKSSSATATEEGCGWWGSEANDARNIGTCI